MVTGAGSAAPAETTEPYQPLRQLLEAFHHGDWSSLLFLVIAACGVGAELVGNHEAMRDWGLRIAAVAGVAYGALAVWVLTPQSAGEFLHLFLRSALAGGFVLGCAWLVLPTGVWLWRHTVGVSGQRLRAWNRERCQRRDKRRTQCDEDRRRQEQQRDHERQAPQREQQQREAEGRRRQEAADAKRREDARLRCELFFTLHEQEIGNRFKREFVTDYLQRYMGDGRPAAEVEDRAVKLVQQMQRALDRVAPPRKLDSVDTILAWYDAEVAKLTRVPAGPQKSALLGQLEARRDELLFKLFEEQQ